MNDSAEMPAPDAAEFAAFVKAERQALGAVVDAWLALSPAGRAFLLPSLVKYEEAHRDDT